MNWFKVETAIMLSPEFQTACAAARGAWISLMNLCAARENGGVIEGASKWSRNDLARCSGLAPADVRSAIQAGLIEVRGAAWAVKFYPAKAEKNLDSARISGAKGAESRWKDKANPNRVEDEDPNGVDEKEPNRDQSRSDQIRSDQTDKQKDSSEPLSATPEPTVPPVLVFATVGKVRTWGMTQEFLDTMSAAFPGMDLLSECRKALAWCAANESRRKTAKGMPAFLNRWIAKANDDRRGGTLLQMRQPNVRVGHARVEENTVYPSGEQKL